MQPAASTQQEHERERETPTDTMLVARSMQAWCADDDSSACFHLSLDVCFDRRASVCVRSLTSSTATRTGRKKTLIVKEKRNIADGRWRFSSGAINISHLYTVRCRRTTCLWQHKMINCLLCSSAYEVFKSSSFSSKLLFGNLMDLDSFLLVCSILKYKFSKRNIFL
jgi:hypothetical protein